MFVDTPGLFPGGISLWDQIMSSCSRPMAIGSMPPSPLVIFLVAALLFKRSPGCAKYWPVTYAFFIASSVNLISDLFGGYNTDFVHLFGFATGENRIIAHWPKCMKPC